MSEKRPDGFTELVESSRSKLALARSRIRRGEGELAILSLHGAIEDALRAHLVRGRSAAAAAVWGQMIDALREDERQPISSLEHERLQRLHALRGRLARGEQPALGRDVLASYYGLAAQLLPRYGVPVPAGGEPAPEEAEAPPRRAGLPRIGARRRDEELEEEAEEGFRRYRGVVLPLLLVVSVFLIGVSISFGLNQLRGEPGRAAVPVAITTVTPPAAPTADLALPTAPPATAAPLPTLPPATPTAAPDVIAVGRQVAIRPEVPGLNVRLQPGVDPAIPVIFSLDPGEVAEVVDGPATADGFTWWQVRTAEGEGWCAGEFLAAR